MRKFIFSLLLLFTSLFADGNLTDELPSSFVDDGVWKAIGLALVAVAAIKGAMIVFRLIKRI